MLTPMNPRLVTLWLAFCLGAVSAQGQHAYRQLREFGFREVAASQPLSGVAEGAGGWLYGTSRGSGWGVLYRVKKDGTEFSIVFDFSVPTGLPSRGPLIVGSDGALYGTLSLFGAEAAVYRIQPDGSGFQFYALPVGARNISGVIEGEDGRLYGATFDGGLFEAGTVFGINKDLTGFAVIHDFYFLGPSGYQPMAEPLEGSDGALYIATRGGGSEGGGVVCRMDKTGSLFSILHRFPASGTNDGRLPNGPLAQGADGYLYGTTEAGGVGGEEDLFSGAGVVFRVSTDGDIYSVVRRFEGGVNDGTRPKDVLVGSDGQLYGTSQNAGFARSVDGIFRMDTSGNNFDLLYTWVGADDQTIQLNPIIESTDGNLYGTSAGGGASNAGQVFKVRPNGTQYLNLHEFSSTGADGSYPSTLILDADGTFYGATLGGGQNDAGTIYKLEPNGTYQILHNFAAEGGLPLGLVAASDDFLYGSSYFDREVFRLGKNGLEYSVLTNLQASPVGALIEGTDFLLYGVTENGGINERGSVFRLNSDGTDLQEVHSFTNISNNIVAPGGILEASDGKLYGTALRGGANDQGMIFKLNKDGTQYEVLYSFVAPIGSVVSPNPLREASDGYLYGTTYRGGGDGQGSIYRISKEGAYEFLHGFATGKGNPVGALAEGPEGWLYGVTQESGNFEGGHVFRFKLGASSAIYILQHLGEGGLGRDPGTGVVPGPAGEIYGTTQYGGFGAGYGTLFRLDVRPVLAIRRTGTDAEISWPWNGENYDLFVSSALRSPFGSSGIVTTNTGERIIATVPLGTEDRFYLLGKTPPRPVPPQPIRGQ
jgi:uncharacterized repeat protein (TIGR03803 family)